MLAVEIQDNLFDWQSGHIQATNGLLSTLTNLTSLHVRLNNTWSKEIWFDFITDRKMYVREPNLIVVQGNLIWEYFLRDIPGGSEPFQA
jgi:hypothetical protein